jgi:hypothetical protein
MPKAPEKKKVPSMLPPDHLKGKRKPKRTHIPVQQLVEMGFPEDWTELYLIRTGKLVPFRLPFMFGINSIHNLDQLLFLVRMAVNHSTNIDLEPAQLDALFSNIASLIGHGNGETMQIIKFANSMPVVKATDGKVISVPDINGSLQLYYNERDPNIKYKMEMEETGEEWTEIQKRDLQSKSEASKARGYAKFLKKEAEFESAAQYLLANDSGWKERLEEAQIAYELAGKTEYGVNLDTVIPTQEKNNES